MWHNKLHMDCFLHLVFSFCLLPSYIFQFSGHFFFFFFLLSICSDGANNTDFKSSLRSKVRRWKTHRDKQVAKGGDDATAETHNQWTVRSDHELCCRSHGNTTCQSGILDMYLASQTAWCYSWKNRYTVYVYLIFFSAIALPCPLFLLSLTCWRWPRW